MKEFENSLPDQVMDTALLFDANQVHCPCRDSPAYQKKEDLLPIEWVKIEGEGEESGSA